MEPYKVLKGMPGHLENVDEVQFGKSAVDYLCLNTPPACNYRCEKCFTWANEGKLKAFIGTERMLELITESKKLGAKVVAILGEGEPLLFKDIKKIVGYINSLGMISLIATNGSLLNKNMVDFLFENNATLAISLDTLDENQYKEFYRGAANLHVLLENISYARKVYSKGIYERNGCRVFQLAVHMTVSARNFQNINHIKEFCSNDIYFSCEHIAKVGIANKNPSIYGGRDEEIYLLCQNASRDIMRPMVITKTEDGKDTCCFFYYGFAVGYEGEVMLDTHAIETKHIIGNIKDDSLLNLIKKTKELKDFYYKKCGGHYCLIRDIGYQNFLSNLNKNIHEAGSRKDDGVQNGFNNS